MSSIAAALWTVGGLRLQDASGEAAKFLGVPLWLWQIVNLVLFAAVLLYFVARPMTAAFRKRQLEVEERRRQAEEHRAEVQRLAAEIRERTARLEKEIEEIRRGGETEGESIRASLVERATQEAERVRVEAHEEIQRRLEAAKAELRATAAGLTAAAASDLLTREINEQDRRRLLEESVSAVKSVR